MSIEQIKVRTPDLLEGMYVARLDRPWLETPYKVQGFYIKTQKDIDKLLQYVDYVYIDVEKSKEVGHDKNSLNGNLSEAQKKQNLTNVKPRQYKDDPDFKIEMKTAVASHAVLTDGVGEVMSDIANNQQLKMPLLRKVVTPMVESIIRNPDAFSWLSMLKTRDDYAYNHSVSSSIWAAAFGRNLGLPKKDLMALATGALLFDVGKIKLPEKLLQKPDRYNQTEFKLIKKHVAYSVEIVQSIEGIGENVIEMVATHHERHSGSGYPRGLKGDEIPIFGKIAGIVDCYDALISDRVYAAAISPHDAVRKLYDWSNIDFQRELVEQFIQVIGIYPVGTIVELSDGRVGAIVAHHRVWKLRPKILLILDKNKQPYPDFKIIDTYEVETGEDDEPLNIIKSVEPGLYGIDPRQFYL
ncbi:MAG: HD-GYP domain-containing protein [Gammaproteobacteria bacterium]|nr:HD-GYP domain-containing protein [Gammaproteobacteria bacterium]MDH3447306.1 HD-GYP domain-containing protein [Gammaproteobacteria bacterium]